MKKTILTIISTSFISTIFVQASSKIEVITNDTSSEEIKLVKSKVTIEECKKYLGIENYNFINEIYSNGNTALLKCKEELKK
ncbi:MAG: hypothetical protein CL623_06855 [Arcobacter sp.]|nr:hypothetical protein [Arcobacter sp.]|tara:strand:+ start:210 stop:455 length:246 start_codon:yes stop_codon:yes gene_type:complete